MNLIGNACCPNGRAGIDCSHRQPAISQITPTEGTKKRPPTEAPLMFRVSRKLTLEPLARLAFPYIDVRLKRAPDRPHVHHRLAATRADCSGYRIGGHAPR